jgi:hypothetical protein
MGLLDRLFGRNKRSREEMIKDIEIRRGQAQQKLDNEKMKYNPDPLVCDRLQRELSQWDLVLKKAKGLTD